MEYFFHKWHYMSKEFSKVALQMNIINPFYSACVQYIHTPVRIFSALLNSFRVTLLSNLLLCDNWKPCSISAYILCSSSLSILIRTGLRRVFITNAVFVTFPIRIRWWKHGLMVVSFIKKLEWCLILYLYLYVWICMVKNIVNHTIRICVSTLNSGRLIIFSIW